MPHSDICGSTVAPTSSQLFAGCHVLHRLSVPRHPPNALRRLLEIRRTQRQAPAKRRLEIVLPGSSAPRSCNRGPSIRVIDDFREDTFALQHAPFRSTANRRAIEPRVATHRLLQGVSRVIAPEDFRNDGVETPDQNLFTMRKNHSGPTLSVPEDDFLADPVDRAARWWS